MLDGEQLKNLRLRLGWTVDEISNISFMSKSSIIRLERGEITKPSTLNYLNLIYTGLRRKEPELSKESDDDIDDNDLDLEDWYALW